MKKNSKIAILLALMLGATTVFTACDDPGGWQPWYSSSGPSVAEQEEQAMNAVYKENISKWLKYVEYDAPEAVQDATYTKLTDKDVDGVTTRYNDGILTTTKVESTFEDVTTGEGENAVTVNRETARKTTVKKQVLSTETFATLLTVEDVKYEKVDEVGATSPDVEKTAQTVSHSVSVHAHLGAVEVVKTTWALRAPLPEETDPVDPAVLTNYEATVTYSYYNAKTGEAYFENLENGANVRGQYVDLEGKTYLMDEDGIVKEFEEGMEYVLPSFDKDNQQIATPYDDYAYFEQGEYGYRIDEGEYIEGETIGELNQGIYPSLSVSVYKADALVATYESDCYSIYGYAVLPNGNVYICEVEESNTDATTDFTQEGVAFNLKHTVLNVQTGAISEVDNAFRVQRLYSNATKDIKTALNLNTTLLTTDANSLEEALNPENNVHNVRVKDGYILAYIEKIENGELTGEVSYAALDANTLAVVEELPAIVESQFGYVGFMTEKELLFTTMTVDNYLIRYTANVETGDLNLFAKSSANIQTFRDLGFRWTETVGEKEIDVVYDYQWNKVADLYYDTIYPLPNGTFLAKSGSGSWEILSLRKSTYDYETGSKGSVQLHKNYLNDAYGDGAVVGENYFSIGTVYYTINGEKLFDSATTERTETIYEADTTTPKYVRYEVTTSYSVNAGVVTLVESWSVDDGYGAVYGYEADEQPTVNMHGKTYYQYFTLK